jgi:hypothetical protein
VFGLCGGKVALVAEHTGSSVGYFHVLKRRHSKVKSGIKKTNAAVSSRT